DVALVNLLHKEVGDMIGAELAAAGEPGLLRLTPRQREVLDLLLDGDAEKQIAKTLGISRPTVHEHVTALYRHFEVSSRAELIALFIGSARPPRVT
ncbi:MAG: helix-turn-helix transcriptional regulator, partial [Phycisphaerales bacterium JB059]